MKAIPVSVADALKMLNLPSDLAGNQIFEQHSPIVIDELEYFTTEDDFEDATEDIEVAEPEEGEEPDAVEYSALQTSFRLAYAFLLLKSTLEFLNLKTVGQGIVKVVGMDSSATELLTGGEIGAMQDALEIRALKAVRKYLSNEGRARLEDLMPRKARLVKAGVI